MGRASAARVDVRESTAFSARSSPSFRQRIAPVLPTEVPLVAQITRVAEHERALPVVGNAVLHLVGHRSPAGRAKARVLEQAVGGSLGHAAGFTAAHSKPLPLPVEVARLGLPGQYAPRRIFVFTLSRLTLPRAVFDLPSRNSTLRSITTARSGRGRRVLGLRGTNEKIAADHLERTRAASLTYH